MANKPKSKNNPSFLNRFLDGFVNSLKISGSSDLFLGIFIILEGLCLLFAPSLFTICIIIGTVIGFTWLIELAVDIINGRKKVRSLLQQILIILILIIAGIFLILMLIDNRLVLNVDRIAVCVTTIIDGIKNLIDANKYEKRILPRIFFSILSLVYINYGAIYLFLGGDGMTSFFTTGMHGIVFIFLGLTDLWFYYFVTKTRRLPEPKDHKPQKSTSSSKPSNRKLQKSTSSSKPKK